MSATAADRPRYRPIQPTPEQEEEMSSLIERLGTSAADPSMPEDPAGPSAPATS